MATLIFIIFAIAVSLILIFLLIQLIKQQKAQQIKPEKFSNSTNISINLPSKAQSINPLNQRLLRLLHGDRDAARRLIEKAKAKNPGCSEDWYYEKVISDLESDRR